MKMRLRRTNVTCCVCKGTPWATWRLVNSTDLAWSMSNVAICNKGDCIVKGLYKYQALPVTWNSTLIPWT